MFHLSSKKKVEKMTIFKLNDMNSQLMKESKPLYTFFVLLY